MRGSPLIRLVVVCFGLAALAWPVAALTTRRIQPFPAGQPNTPEPVTADFVVRVTASTPALFSVGIAGEDSPRQGTGHTFLTSFRMNASAPEDLQVGADFPDSKAESAVRVEVLREGRRLVDSSFWGNGSIQDAVSIPTP